MIAMGSPKPTAAALRAAIAHAQLPQYIVAAKAGLHPTRLSIFLRERRPLSTEIAERVLTAVQDLVAEKEGSQHGR